jgi:hypothetical protein
MGDGLFGAFTCSDSPARSYYPCAVVSVGPGWCDLKSGFKFFIYILKWPPRITLSDSPY